MKKTVILLFALASLAASTARAQEVSISAAPIRVEHLTKQGEKGTDVINLTNSGTTPVRLRVSIEEWTVDEKGAPIFSKPAGAEYSCAAWIRVNPLDFRIEPGQTREIRYSLAVPSDVRDGGYHAAIVFRTVVDVKPGEPIKNVMIQGRLAVIVYERVGAPAVEGRIERLRTKNRADGVDFILEISNSGAVHFRTKGKITVKDPTGRTVVELDVPDAPVIQGVRRLLEVPYTGPLAKGSYTVRAVLDIGMKDRIGLETTLAVGEDIPKK
jgi:hypothetical protein